MRRGIERQLQVELFRVLKDLIRERKVDNVIDAVVEEGRSDILLFKARTKKPILSLELKDPIAPDGRSVFHHETYVRERKRAENLGCEAFGISNFIETVIFNFNPNCPSSLCEWIQKKGEALQIDQVERYRTFLKVTPDIEEGLKNIAKFVLDHTLQMLKGQVPVLKPPDERLIYKLRSLIEVYVPDLVYALKERYRKDKEFKNRLNKWFRDQLWTIPSSDQDFEKAAYISLLMLVSKLIFYKALCDTKIYPDLPKLFIYETVENAETLKRYLFEEHFNILIEVTGDYENLIGEPDDVLNEIPFIVDTVVDFVKSVVQSEEFYDFSKLQYDVIGRIFEELIREEERHKLGQYFTPSSVVDLINAFCIRTGDEKVLDPTCGSGAFLVRAYERKKRLRGKNHAQLLKEIYGTDISTYAVELATLNLAIRDFRYKTHPQVYRKDFFRVRHTDLGAFDAVIGNPPYTRQEEIDDIIPGEKEVIYEALALDYGKNFKVSKRSSLYAYVFYHSGVFLKEGGYLGFITSNSYLDTDYGIDLQKWMLENFRIVAVIDSKVERFFPSADVNTCVTILQKEGNEDARNSNLVKFVYLKKKLEEVLNRFGDADSLRDFIEQTKDFYEDEYLRIKPVPQKELYNHTKWGVFLRAGDVYWRIIGKTEWVKLKDIADVRFGIKTGDNDFFYLEDVTENIKDDSLSAIRNITKDIKSVLDIRAKRLRVAKNGKGELWLIEEELLKPVVKSPREIKSYVIKPGDLKYKVLYFGMKDRFEGIEDYVKFVRSNFPYAWRYIEEGEREGIDQKPTCSGRSPWWDLGEWVPADIIIPCGFRDRFPIVFNRFGILEDKRLYGITLKQKVNELFLISTIFHYFIEVNTRNYGGGGGPIDATVEDIENLPLPKHFISGG